MEIIGNANVTIAAERYLNVNLNGLGNVIYKGNQVIEKNITGSGSVKKFSEQEHGRNEK